MDRPLRTAIVLAGLFSVVGGAAAGTEADYQTLRVLSQKPDPTA